MFATLTYDNNIWIRFKIRYFSKCSISRRQTSARHDAEWVLCHAYWHWISLMTCINLRYCEFERRDTRESSIPAPRSTLCFKIRWYVAVAPNQPELKDDFDAARMVDMFSSAVVASGPAPPLTSSLVVGSKPKAPDK